MPAGCTRLQNRSEKVQCDDRDTRGDCLTQSLPLMLQLRGVRTVQSCYAAGAATECVSLVPCGVDGGDQISARR